MAASQQYSLRWNNYLRHITYAFDNLRMQDEFVDVTLCCDGHKIKAHKVLLSACSGYFKEIFKENPCTHPVIIFKFIKYEDLLAIIEFMYQGEVNVQQDALQSFLQTAELLAVQGLTTEEKEKPKAPRTQLDQRVYEEQIIKALPTTTVRTVTENNTQTSTIELQTILPSAKKRKIAFSEDDDDVYSETVQFPKDDSNIVKTTEIQYLPSTVKMDIPEYIDVVEANQLEDNTEQAQQTSHDTTTQTTNQFTSEYEILTESELDDKYQTNDGNETTEITTMEMSRIFTTQTSTENSQNETKVTVSDLPNSKWTECQFCKMVITTVNLWRHIRTQHTPQAPRKCELCQKNFKNKYSLREHIRISHEQKQIKTHN